MKKYEVELNVDVKGAEKVKEVDEDLQNINESTKDVSESTEDMGGTLDTVSGGMVSRFASLKTAVLGGVKAFKSLKFAIAATGLGLLIIALASVKAAFTSTEEGQNKFNKIMNAIGVITGNLIDLLAEFGNVIIEAFENPKQAIQYFAALIKKNIEVRIQSTIDMFGFLASAVKKVFSGDFAGAMDDAKAAGNKFIDSTTGVENTLDKVISKTKDLVKEMKEEIEISNKLSDLQSRNDKLTRKQLVERARLEGEIADLRLKSEQEDLFSVSEREAALKRALVLNEEIFAREEEIAANALTIQRERNKLSGSTKEDLDQEAQLEASLILLQKQRADQAKRMTTRLLELSRRRIAAADAEFKSVIDLAIAENDALIDLEIGKFDAFDEASAGYWDAETQRMFKNKKESDDFHESKKKNLDDLKNFAVAGLQVASSFIKMLAEEVDTNTREGFEKNKKLRLAGIVADTLAAGIAGMLAGLSAGGPWGIALGAITAASALAFGAVQYGKLKKSTFDGGGDISSGASVPNISASPSSSLITPLSADAANAAVASPEPQKAYVLQNDVSSNDAIARNISDSANF